MDNKKPDYNFSSEAELLKTLGHPIRLKIIEVLINNKSCVKNIWETLGLPQATISQHLVSLKNRGVVSCKRDGVMMCYELSDKRVEKIFNDLRDENGNSPSGNHNGQNEKTNPSVSLSLPK